MKLIIPLWKKLLLGIIMAEAKAHNGLDVLITIKKAKESDLKDETDKPLTPDFEYELFEDEKALEALKQKILEKSKETTSKENKDAC